MYVEQLKGLLLGDTPPKPAPKGMFPWEMEWDIKAASSCIWQNVMLHLSPFSIQGQVLFPRVDGIIGPTGEKGQK